MDELNKSVPGVPLYIPLGLSIEGLTRTSQGTAWVPKHRRIEVERAIACHKIRLALSRPVGDRVSLLNEIISEFE